MALRETREDDAIESVAKMMDDLFLKKSPFHLAPCGGCGGPAFQQPCPICGFYPRGEDKGSWSPQKATLEIFEAAVEESGPDGHGGNIATWLLSSYDNKNLGFDYSAERVKAAEMELPSAEEIWNTVSVQGITLNRKDMEADVVLGWSAAFELKQQVSIAMGRSKLHVKDANRSTEVIRAWIDVSRSHDTDKRTEAHRLLGAEINRINVMVGPNGNLGAASRDTDIAARRLFADEWDRASSTEWYRQMPPIDVGHYVSGETDTMSIGFDGKSYWLGNPKSSGQGEYSTLSAAKEAGEEIICDLEMGLGKRLAEAEGLESDAWFFIGDNGEVRFHNATDPSIRIIMRPGQPSNEQWAAVRDGEDIAEAESAKAVAELLMTAPKP